MLQRKISSLSNLPLFESETFTKNYFRKKKLKYCYGFMPANFQAICGSMVGENRQSSASNETPASYQYF